LAIVHEGSLLYMEHCFFCHGFAVISGSSVPDLRYATAETHLQLQSIVLGGARESRGVPSFKDVLTPEQVHAIQAYILSRSAAAAH